MDAMESCHVRVGGAEAVVIGEEDELGEGGEGEVEETGYEGVITEFGGTK